MAQRQVMRWVATPSGHYCAEVAELQAVVDEWMTKGESIHILEAGCGSLSYLFWPESAHVTGVDISPEQLDRNTAVSEKILGDLQTVELPADTYDVVVCWNVLEHLPNPELAVANLVGATRPGGIVILAFPNPMSIKGLVAKFTPHWFHVWVYRHMFGIKDAGKADTAPFRTILRWSISPRAIRNTAGRLGLDIVYERLYESGMQEHLRTRHRFVNAFVSAATLLLRLATFGRLDGRLSDCFYVLRRRIPARSAVRLGESDT